MDSRERADMDLVSQAISALVTKQIVTNLVKHVIVTVSHFGYEGRIGSVLARVIQFPCHCFPFTLDFGEKTPCISPNAKTKAQIGCAVTYTERN